ncbi:uncharacterized protein LOC141718545 [Apium graveolens]|uniref:uncharacterized protein LOC141718545 n=1 Tax=Apium graveolens TaxID=4045 RepID=UPI003D7A340B
MQLFQLPVFLIIGLCSCFSLAPQFLASVATPTENSVYKLAVADLLSPTQEDHTSPIPKLQKAVPAFGRINTFATYAIVVITVLNIVMYKLKHSHEEYHRESNIQPPSSFENQWRLFSIREILLATHNFDENLFLGRGGFGKVYKGILIDGAMTTVAVKRLNSKSRQGAREFWTEIEMLSNIRHSHIVSLIGYCNENHEMILVYEYMPHGTLSDHLYKNSRNGSVAFQPLSWEQRLKICVGAARGLDYLHTGTGLQKRVIHRDVKSSNILLDEHWEAKVSDFGLSKIGPANQSCSHVSTNVKGTPGYMDPEYFLTHRLTRKSDVYAFGVVLFEVLCGRRALDLKIDKDQRALAQYAHRCIQEGTIDQIIDSSLRGQISKDCLQVFVDIGDQCLHYQQRKRPTMSDVVAKLEFAMELVKKTESSIDYAFPRDTRRVDDHQENNDTVGVVENLEDDVGLVLCNQEDDAVVVVENQRNFPSLKKRDKGVLKFVARKMFKAILVVRRGKKNIAGQNTDDGISSSSRPTYPESFTNGRTLSTESSSAIIRLSEETHIPQFSFLKIQAATNSFHAGLVLTYGHQGMVFKGHLDSEEVVIKQLILTSQRRRYQSFRNEILHSKVNHLHVLPLIGFCCDSDDVYRLYLVSKYMSNGSLDYHLHNENYDTPLTWNLRLQICIGVAKGLNYLHTGIASQIITHGKMKPNKILLDENWIPKVSGYGLWKLGTSGINKDNYLRSQELVPPFDFWETWAYLSPEQKAQEQLTPKADVYSMGVVLLNVLFDWRQIIMTLARLNNAQDVVKRLESALELQINHTWNFFDDEINQLECALQIQLQTNHAWRLDVDGNDHIGMSTWRLDGNDDDHIGMSAWSLNGDNDDLRMNSWISNLDDTQMSIPNYDFDSIEIVR